MKRRGILTVEVTLLMLVILSVSTLIIATHLKIEYHNKLFDIIAQAGEDTAKSVYAAGRFEASVLEDGKLFDSKTMGIVSQLINTQLSVNINNINQSALQGLMLHNVLKQANVKDHAQFITKYNLNALPEFDFKFDENVMFVSAKLSYRSVGPLSHLVSFEPEIRHSIPLRRARTLVSGYSDRELERITVTDNGIENTQVYHTTKCFGLRFAKSNYEYYVDKEKLGGNIEINGRKYTICQFCKRNRK